MLPSENRLRRPADFRHALRRGRRAAAPTLVVHAARSSDQHDEVRVRVGFVVSKAVGGAVVRNRVKRRLRHAVRPELGTLGGRGAVDLVVRALPPAASSSFAVLSSDLHDCLATVGGAAS